jgi:hypothetical protein
VRIRQLKPEWWDDKALQTRITPACREFYIGLWHNADDAGYLRWDADAIAAALYPYKGMRTRERQVRRWADELKALDPESPHLILLDCGRHGRVPKMPGHQVVAATRRWTKYAQEHTSQCLDSALSMTSPEGTVRNGTGKERGGTGGVAPSPSEAGRSHLEVVDGQYRVRSS